MADSRNDEHDRVWCLIEKIGVTMFVTSHGDTMDARPLQAHPDRDANLIYFMTDSAHVLNDTNRDARVLLNFADKGANDYVSVDGVASVTNDRAKIRELWSPWAKAFWDTPENPDIRVIAVSPEQARYWDGPNMVVTSISIITSAILNKKPELGKSGDVSLKS